MTSSTNNRKTISATVASCVMGCGYINNVELWEEFFTGKKPMRYNMEEFLQYGKHAEEHLLQLLALDYPEYTLESNVDIEKCSIKPYRTGKVDAKAMHSVYGNGFIEIKTMKVHRSTELNIWKDGSIPLKWYWQMIHYFLINPTYKFGVLKAQVKLNWSDDFQIKHRLLLRDNPNTLASIEYLDKEEDRLWNHVLNKTKPNLKLPII